jgi:bacteriocin biosynthesis cyclodehydratase domain-containing protein
LADATTDSALHPTSAAQEEQPVLVQLRPGAHVLEISADTLQIAFANYTVTLNSPPVVKAASSLLKTLRHATTRDSAVCSAASANQLTEPFVQYVLETLTRTRCLIEIPDGWQDLNEPNDAFLGYISDQPALLRDDLAAARPLLIDFGDGSAAALELAVAGGLTGAAQFAVKPGTPCTEVLDGVAEALDEASMLIVWGLPYRLGLTASLNDLAIARDKSVLFGACEGLVGRVGPFVIPGNTACLECAVSRMLAHAGAPEQRAMPAYRARHRDVVPTPWPTSPVFEGAVLAQLVLEAVRIAGRLGVRTVGGILEYRFADGCAERHNVLRVPRCPACHPARPPRLPWDAIFPAPVVKNSV